ARLTRRRPATRDRDSLRRPPPARRPDLPPAHRLRLVPPAAAAPQPNRLERGGVPRRKRRGLHGSLQLSDHGVSQRRDAYLRRLERAPIGARGERLENSREADQSDRQRPEPAQSKSAALDYLFRSLRIAASCAAS